jgi:hypothetical protein
MKSPRGQSLPQYPNPQTVPAFFLTACSFPFELQGYSGSLCRLWVGTECTFPLDEVGDAGSGRLTSQGPLSLR